MEYPEINISRIGEIIIKESKEYCLVGYSSKGNGIVNCVGIPCVKCVFHSYVDSLEYLDKIKKTIREDKLKRILKE